MLGNILLDIEVCCFCMWCRMFFVVFFFVFTSFRVARTSSNVRFSKNFLVVFLL